MARLEYSICVTVDGVPVMRTLGHAEFKTGDSAASQHMLCKNARAIFEKIVSENFLMEIVGYSNRIVREICSPERAPFDKRQSGTSAWSNGEGEKGEDPITSVPAVKAERIQRPPAQKHTNSAEPIDPIQEERKAA